MPVLLDEALSHGIQIAFHLEPYDGRSARSVAKDIEQLQVKYGHHPGVYRLCVNPISAPTSPTRRTHSMCKDGTDARMVVIF